jgi:hypothetical protein
LPDDYPDARTMAELSPEEKGAISHRGRAARALLRLLDEPGGPRLRGLLQLARRPGRRGR